MPYDHELDGWESIDIADGIRLWHQVVEELLTKKTPNVVGVEPGEPGGE